MSKRKILVGICAAWLSSQNYAYAQQDRATECGGGYIKNIMFNTASGDGMVPPEQYNTANIMVSLDFSLEKISSNILYVQYESTPNDEWIYISYSGGNAPDNTFTGNAKYKNLRDTLLRAYLSGSPVRIEMSKPTSGYNANLYACINSADQVTVWVCDSQNTSDCKAPPAHQ